MAEKTLGENIKKLGFGLMRLPEKDGEIDVELVKKMVDLFIARGFTYFDTAYVYNNGGSELAAKAALVERYPRESFQLADKLPMGVVQTEEDLPKAFQTSLERTGAGYFDFYLLHALGAESAAKADRLGCWAFIQEMKAKGLIRHIGFSFHDKADVLDDILTRHPEVEFVQLQINYYDWDSENVQSRLCYEVARKHGKYVTIMEPVKGGALATEEANVTKLFRDADPNASNASWAVRFAASLDGVIVALSGMSNLEQVEDNTGYMENFKPLTDAEREIVFKAADILKSIPGIPCTSCRYCVDGCPMEIGIPRIIAVYNDYLRYGILPVAQRSYAFATGRGAKASACIECRACEGTCPQHIEITDVLKKAVELFE